MFQKSNIILALDFDTGKEAIKFLKNNNITPEVCKVKVGMQLFYSEGKTIIKKLHKMGFDVFLDLKLLDTADTIANTSKILSNMNVWMFNIHIWKPATLKAALENKGNSLLSGVTILTDTYELDLYFTNLIGDLKTNIKQKAELAKCMGLDAVICAASDIQYIKEKCPEIKTIVPGIRFSGDSNDCQIRVDTPENAINLGADYLVLGRTITKSKNPKERLEYVRELYNKGCN